MRDEDIRALLKDSSESIAVLRLQAGKGSINSVKVKNTVENLRSALDYLAHDIQERMQELQPNRTTATKVYFPYAKNKKEFDASVQRNLPDLPSALPEVYVAILQTQNFTSGKTWLVDLCALTNAAKHNSLQRAEPEFRSVIQGGGIIRITGTGNSISGNIVNGKLMDDVSTNSRGEVTYHKKNDIEVTVTPDNKMILPGRKVDAIDLLEKSFVGVSLLSDVIYKQISNTKQ